MKKITTLIAVTLLSTASLIAQKNTLTFSAGFHNSNTKTNGGSTELLDIKPVASMGLGINWERKLDEKLSFEAGLNYTQKGFQVGAGTDINVLGMDLPLGAMALTKINYLTVPATLKLNIDIPKSYVTPYIGVGPSVSYALSGQLETKLQAAIFDLNVSTTELELSSANYNRAQVNGQAIVGADIAYGLGSLRIEAGYHHSFTDLISNDFVIDAGGKHHGWNLSLGYGMRF